MNYGDYSFSDEYEYPMYVVVGGEYYVRCCERLQKLELRGGVYSIECSECGKEWAVGEDFKHRG